MYFFSLRFLAYMIVFFYIDTVKTKTRQQNDFFYIFLPLVPHNKARKSPKQVLPNTYICVGPPHQFHKKQGFYLVKQRGIYSKNIYICLIMERNPTMTDIYFLLRQITTEDNKLSFQRLFELYYPALCIYTKRFISDRETREDIVQEVFSSIWENRKRIVIRTSARNYLITATKNHSLNYLQRNHEEYVDQFSQEQIPIYAESGEELYTWEELQTLLREALAKLPENYRYVFEKNRFENKSYGEIAEDMQISIRTVERYKNKAIEILKTELKDYLPLFIGWLF